MLTPKKILFIVTKANWGGAQKYVFDLATAFPDAEIVVAYGQPFGELEQRLRAKHLRTIRLPNLQRNIFLKQELRVAKNLWRIFKQEQPNIIHLNSSKVGGLGTLIGRLAGIKKIIFTAHGWAFNENRCWLSKIVIKIISWLTILLSHQTITISQRDYQQVIHWPFISPNKLKLIYNGIKPIEFLTRQAARQKLKLQDEDIVIGTISELHKNKGLQYALEGFALAVQENPRLRFVMVGAGEEENFLQKKIEQLGLTEKVLLVGGIARASRYLQAFDIFLLSSIKEGLPFVLLEAGLAKLPVIATDVGGVAEIVENKKTGILIKPKNEKFIGDALLKLLSDQRQWQSLGENLYTKIQEKFSFEEMLKKTKKIYL